MRKPLQVQGENAGYQQAIVLGKEERELYVETVAIAAKKFGNDSTAFRTITHWIKPKMGLGFQYFWAVHLNECLPQNQKVLALEQMEKIISADGKFFGGFYTYVPEIILRTDRPVTKKERFILAELVAQVKQEGYGFSPEMPLRISGLRLVKDENLANPYGLLLKFGNDTKILTDERFAYSTVNKKIKFGSTLKNVWTCVDGLATICLGGGTSLYTEGGFAIYADCVCRAVIVEARDSGLEPS